MKDLKKSSKQIATMLTAFLMLPLCTSHSFGNMEPKWNYLDKPLHTNFSENSPPLKTPNLPGITAQQETQYAPNQIIIKLKLPSNLETKDTLVSKKINILNDLKKRFKLSNDRKVFPQYNNAPTQLKKTAASSYNFSNVYLMNINEGNVLDVASKLSKEDNIEYAEPNYIYKIQKVPNDPYYSSSGAWGQSFDDLWGLKAINSSDAWDMSLGEGILVAVIDTGLDRHHADIAANVWHNPKEILGNNFDDDNNGFVDDISGWDFSENDNNPSDYDGHGTHVSGTIAATMNNSIGIVGVAPKAQILAIKGLNDQGTGSTVNLASALVYAADMNADIINNSWGGFGQSKLLHDAVKYAHNKGTVVVASAGNDSSPASRYQPAGFPESITVVGFDTNKERALFSNWGTRIDVSAPAVDVLSLFSTNANPDNYPSDFIIDKHYLRLPGTSMAAPHVSGLIALMLSLESDLTPEQIRYFLHNSSIDAGTPGFDILFGYGMINAQSTLHLVDELEDDAPDLFASIVTPLPGYITGRQLELTGTAAGHDFEHYTIEWKVNDPQGNNTYTVLQSSDDPIKEGVFGVFDTSIFPDNQEIMIQLNVFDEDEQKTSYHTVIFVDKSLEPGWPQKNAPSSNRGGFDTSETYADLNNDGQTEIISTVGDTIAVYDLQGKLLPGFPVVTPRPINATVSIGDIDNDGFDEVLFPVVGTPGENASIHALNFDGSSVEGYPIDYTFLAGDNDHEIVFGQALIVADVDNDGELEIALNVRQWPLRYDPNNPGINLKHLAILNAKGELEQGWPIEVTKEFSFLGGAMAVVDYEKDGDMEIAINSVVNGKTHLSVYEHTGEKRFGIDTGGSTPPSHMIIEDITKDGHYEILTVGQSINGASKVSMISDQGNYVDGWPRYIGSRYGTEPFTVITDEDDNKFIMVVGEYTFNYFKSDGTFVSIKDIPSPNNRGVLVSTDIVRLDHHGSKHGTQAIYLGGGNRIFKFDLWGNLLFSKRTNSTVKAPVIGDINNDNAIEIATVANDGSTYLWKELDLQEKGNITGWLTSGANNARTYSTVTPYPRVEFSKTKKHYNTQNRKPSAY